MMTFPDTWEEYEKIFGFYDEDGVYYSSNTRLIPSFRVKQWLEHLPLAESEVIRCKDCKHWDTTWTNDFAPNYHYCPLVDGTRRDDFYCADAERRGDSK